MNRRQWYSSAVTPVVGTSEANNYANLLVKLLRLEEAKSLLRKTIPVARRVFGESHELTLRMRWVYSCSLYKATSATLDDLREAVTTLEDLVPLWTRIYGEAHPETPKVQGALATARGRLARALAAAAGSAEKS